MRRVLIATLALLSFGFIFPVDAVDVNPCEDVFCIGGRQHRGGNATNSRGNSVTTVSRQSDRNNQVEPRTLTPEQKAFNDALGIGCIAQLTAGVTNPCPPAEAQPVQAAAAAPAPLPELTPGIVAAAFQKIPVPKERSITQPGNKTLVNFDTIFYTEAEGFRRTVTLVGQRVTLDISPAQYTWHHGDGTTSVTDSPGGPYPDKSVIYRYEDAHTTVSHHVVVTWGARFRVNGGAWNPVPGTVTSVGPATDLRIAEATPVLSGVSERR